MTVQEQIRAHYPDLYQKVVTFLTTNKDRYINLAFDPYEVDQAVQELLGLTDAFLQIARENRQHPFLLFSSVTAASIGQGPIEVGSADKVGIVRIGEGSTAHRYHVLWRLRNPSQQNADCGNNLLVMLQRVGNRVNTGAEVHGVVRDENGVLTPSAIGGIEVQVPLVDSVDYRVGDTVYRVNALEGGVVILPGDIHSVQRCSEAGDNRPLRALIIGAYGFTRGISVNMDTNGDVTESFGNIYGGFNSIARYYPLR